jgi:FtsP/CotA-like multicopper oxidase with cupredoxin domain
LKNQGPDEPFGGGIPGVDFEPADPATTGQVMEFRVRAGDVAEPTTPPINLVLPAAIPLGPSAVTRELSLNEEESKTVRVEEEGEWNIVLECEDPEEEEFGPVAALLGTLNPDGSGAPLVWSDAITENPALGATETWELYNFTVDAHPIHIHQVKFEVVGREPLNGGVSVAGSNEPQPGETGYKDTVIAYPGEITRVKALYDLPGFYVWHCHIVEHEDNEMMRPFHVGPIPPDAPAG